VNCYWYVVNIDCCVFSIEPSLLPQNSYRFLKNVAISKIHFALINVNCHVVTIDCYVFSIEPSLFLQNSYSFFKNVAIS